MRSRHFECNQDFSPTSLSERKNKPQGRSFTVMTKRKAAAISMILVALGYSGAALSYSYLIGLHIEFPYACPVCPEIFSLGSPTGKFIGRTIVLGTLNAALLAAVGWLLVGIGFRLNRLFRRIPPDLGDEWNCDFSTVSSPAT
ncbi:MAG TPA: hypothetical protein VFA85_07760 [Terriglobales bacterium]|jgi:hypothetical protein|nr:hypothetical protein [Terriglobales bacterium]